MGPTKCNFLNLKIQIPNLQILTHVLSDLSHEIILCLPIQFKIEEIGSYLFQLPNQYSRDLAQVFFFKTLGVAGRSMLPRTSKLTN